MTLRKVAFGDRSVQRKRPVRTSSIVSYWRDEFDGDGNTAVIVYGSASRSDGGNYGISKKEDKISAKAHWLNDLKRYVDAE